MSLKPARPSLLHTGVIAVLAIGAAAAILHAGSAQAQARNPFSVGVSEGGGYYTGFAGWLLSKQAFFERLLSTAVRAVKTDRDAMWTLTGLSFAYGVFHAAGPGHGKAVVASYLVANERALRRGLVISLLAALLQGLVAILLIGVLALVLHATSPVMRDTASLIEKASFAGIAVLGLWLVWRKGGALLHAWANPYAKPRVSGSAFVCEPCGPETAFGAIGGCCAFHMPDPGRLGADFSWKSAALTVLAAGMRPCSGAILVLVFALAQGLFLVGVGSTFAMSLGTAVTTASLAAFAVLAKDLALRLTRPGSRRAMLVARGAEFLAACLVLFFGVALLMGMAAADI
jgi:nickel/cobalt exporter